MPVFRSCLIYLPSWGLATNITGRTINHEAFNMHYYPFNIGDYRRDTSHLSLLEHGVYRQLLDSYYLSEKPLPFDEKILFRQNKIKTEKEKSTAKYILQEFFTQIDGEWFHSGCSKVIEKYKEKSEKAKASAEKRWSKQDDSAMRTHIERNANGMLTNNHKPITNNHEPIVSVKPNRKHPVPVDFTLSDTFAAAAVTYWQKKNRTELNAHDEFELFTAHHKKNGSCFADWGAAWQTWYTNAVKFSRRKERKDADFIASHTGTEWAGGLQ